MCFSYKGLYSQMGRGVIALASDVTFLNGKSSMPVPIHMVYKTRTILDVPMMKTKGAHTTL